MIKEEDKKLILSKRKEHRKLLSKTKDRLDEELYEYCVSLGGHDFSEIEEISEMWAAGQVSFKRKVCSCCFYEVVTDFKLLEN